MYTSIDSFMNEIIAKNKSQEEFVTMIENSLMNLDIKKQINLSILIHIIEVIL